MLEFMGQPIIAYTITAALETGLFDSVVVSTEDAEIAEIASSFGAQVSHRAPSLATDSASVVDVALDFIAREEQAGREYGQLALLYATAPSRTAQDIIATIGLLDSGNCSFALAVTEYSQQPHQALVIGEDQFLRPWLPELINRRSNTLERLLTDNGSTYAVSVPAFRRERSFYGPGLRGHEMPRERSVDIDTRIDYELALTFANRLNQPDSHC